MECIPFESEGFMWKAVAKMLAFQGMHNRMIKEINALFSHTETNMSNPDLGPVLIKRVKINLKFWKLKMIHQF